MQKLKSEISIKIEFPTSGFEANFHSTRISFLVGEDVSNNPYGIIFIFRVKLKKKKVKKKKHTLQNQLFEICFLSFDYFYVLFLTDITI